MKVLVIIPTYNERENVLPIVKAVLAVTGSDTHVLVCDDNSPDQTAQLVEGFMTTESRLHLLVRREKQGLGPAGFYYDTTISFQNPLISQRVFFSAVFFNYGCTVLTAWVVTRMVWRQFENRAYALLFGAAYLLGFGTLFYSINPLTDAFAYLLCALIFEAYFLRSWWILPLLVMAVVQREIIFAYIALMALFDGVLKRTPRKYALGAFVASILGAISYVVLRKTIFYTSKHSEQMEVSSFLDRILHPQIDVGDYIRQVFLNQNILLFYLLVVAYKLFKKLSVNQGNATLIAALYLQGVVIGFVALLGNNLGRFVNLLSPLILLFAAIELKQLIQDSFRLGSEKTVQQTHPLL